MIDITVTIDQRDYDRYMAKLAKLEGRLRYDKVDRTLLAVASNIVMPVGKRLTPVGPKLKTQAGHPPGNLRRSWRARRLDRRWGEVAAAIAKPTAPHTHLVVLGTMAHSLEGGTSKYRARSGKSPYSVLGIDEVRFNRTLFHPGSRGNPFVDRTYEQTRPAALAAIERDVFGAL